MHITPQSAGINDQKVCAFISGCHCFGKVTMGKRGAVGGVRLGIVKGKRVLRMGQMDPISGSTHFEPHFHSLIHPASFGCTSAK